MAKLTGPLVSLSAAGRLSPELVYREAPTGPVVRSHGPNVDARTAAQLLQRARYSQALALWRSTSWTALELLWWAQEAKFRWQYGTAQMAMMSAALTAYRAGELWTPVRLDHFDWTPTNNWNIYVQQAGVAANPRGARALSPGGPFVLNAAVANQNPLWRVRPNPLTLNQQWFGYVTHRAADNNAGRTPILSIVTG